MNTLILTVGLPRSGKSTWAKEQGCPIVNPDSIRLSLYGCRYFAGGEKFVWAIARTMVEALFLAGHDKVIVDATNTTVKRRAEWKGDWTLGVELFSASVFECIGRAKTDGDYAIIPIIERMGEQWEPIDEFQHSST